MVTGEIALEPTMPVSSSGHAWDDLTQSSVAPVVPVA
jgi:hypothetical protein